MPHPTTRPRSVAALAIAGFVSVAVAAATPATAWAAIDFTQAHERSRAFDTIQATDTLGPPPRFFILDPVVATVSPLRDGLGYQAAHAISGDNLTRRLDGSIGAMLDGEPGVAMRSMGPAPARPVVRGFDGDRVLVLENGERMGDLAESAADHAVALDPLAVDRIEIVRGPAGLLYGSSALGGVVNLMTADLPTTWSRGWNGTLTTQASSVDRAGAGQLQVLRGGKDSAVTGRASLREAGELRTPESRLPGTYHANRDAQLGVVRESGALRTGVSLSLLDRDYGIPEGIDDADEEAVISMARQAVQGRLDWSPDGASWIEGLELRLNAARLHQEEIEREFAFSPTGTRIVEDEDIELEFLQHAIGVTSTLRHGRLGPLDEGALGASLRARSLEVGGEEAFTPGIRGTTLGLFAFQELRLRPTLRLQFGTRAEGHRGRTLANDDFEGGETRSSLALSGSLGLNWRPAPHWELGAQVARAHRNPSLEELFANGPHLGAGAFEIGDPSLRDEIGHGLDVFVRRGSDRLAVELAAFLSGIRDFVAFSPTGEVDPGSELPIFRYEATDAVMVGGEASASLRLPGGWQATTGIDLVRGDRRAEGTARSPLPTIPPLRGRFDLRRDGESGWIGATARAIATQDRVAPMEEVTEGAFLLGFDAGWRIDPRGRHILVVRVENATNTLYRDHLSRVEERGFPMPGRNLSVILRTGLFGR